MATRYNFTPGLAKTITEDLMARFESDFLNVAREVAVQTVVRDTGNLSRSIQWRRESAGHWAFFTETGYGAYVELGTSRMAARPCMGPGIAAAQREFGNSLR